MNQPHLSIHSLAKTLGERLKASRRYVTAAESCTGGSLCVAITDVPGSSSWFDGGLVTYSNASKTTCLGIPQSLLNQHGAVSETTAIAMAEGALKQSTQATVSIAITGIAGPDGGSKEKPIGTVWIACATDKKNISKMHLFTGNRPAIRQQAVFAALSLLIEFIE